MPEPDPANPDLKRFATDKEGLKRDLFARIQARGERATPALVEKELPALERVQAARAAIDAVRAAGGTAHYYSVNITDRRECRQSDRGCARNAAGASTCCCTPPGSSAATCFPIRTRANSTWSSTSRAMAVPPAARHRRHAARGDGRVQLDRRPVRQRGTDGLQFRQRSAVQDRLELPPDAAADARHRHRLDRVGRHRDGHARLDPEDDGDWPASTCCRPKPAFR